MHVHNPTAPCSCTVDFTRRAPGSPTNEFAIRYCPTHAAAPRLVAALGGLCRAAGEVDAYTHNLTLDTDLNEALGELWQSVNDARAALAAAKGEG